jgi:hypothetical protein
MLILLPVSKVTIEAGKDTCEAIREGELNSAEEERNGILAYIEASRDVQRLLQQVLTQVAGYSLMLMTSSRRAPQLEGAILMARAAADRASDQARALRAPASAAHHRHHLLKASEATCWAFVAAETCAAPGAGDSDRDGLSRALGQATRHLRATSRLLPGFEMVDFGQACCAMYATATTQRAE